MRRSIYTVTVLALGCLSTAAYAQPMEMEFDDVEKVSNEINSNAEDIMPLLTSDGKTMYFVRARHESNTGGVDKGHDIWMSKMGDDGEWSTATNAFPTLNNESNNAVIGITANELYLLNAYKEQKVGEDERGIAVAKEKSGAWLKPDFVKLPKFTSNSPFQSFYVAPEGDLMIMAVATEGSLGKEDLYVSTKENGTWQAPIHLGSKVNSAGFEMSPFLSANRKHLYFSSDGHGGIGNADIFVAERLDDTWTNWSEPENLGDKINSSGFDAYLTIAPDSTFYFSSTRDGSMSDIYTTRIKEEEPVVEVIPDEPDTLTPPPPPPPKTPVFNNIYFETDGYGLNAESKTELDGIYETLVKHPEYNLAITGHTDITWKDSYNIALSKRRAKSAYDYLVKKGIDGSRMSTNGHGEAHPVAVCDEADCTPEQHARNRRTEFKIF